MNVVTAMVKVVAIKGFGRRRKVTFEVSAQNQSYTLTVQEGDELDLRFNIIDQSS